MSETTDEQPSFGDAMRELETILDRIEGEAVDLDELSGQVARAAELIKLCRDKIETTEEQVESIMADLKTDTDSA
jgi:exodeoxyribonuclease VII small subunit